MQVGMSWYELGEGVDNGNDGLAKLLAFHSVGHPKGAGSRHAATFCAYSTA